MKQNKEFLDQRRAERRSFYKKGAWVKVRKAQLRKASLCQHCLKQGKLVSATVCDHIDPLWESWDEFIAGPFQSLCRQCHSIKSAFDIPKVKKAERCKLRVRDV